MNRTKSAFRFVGDIVTILAGTHTIQVQQIREGVYRVEVLGSGPVARPVDDLAASWPTAELAFDHAYGLAELYRAEARTLADTVPSGTHRQVAPTMAGAQLAKVSDSQHRALATAAAAGRVNRGSGQNRESVATLKALARKGYLTLTMRPGKRYDIDFGVITLAGERELDRLDAAEARRDQRSRTLARLSA